MKRHIVVKNAEINLSEVVYYDFEKMEGRAVGHGEYLLQIFKLLSPQIYYKIQRENPFRQDRLWDEPPLHEQLFVIG